MHKCNQGGAAAVIGINVRSGAYPTASNKICKADNNTDAATFFNNPASIPVTETRENGAELAFLDATSSIQNQLDALSGGGGSSLELLNNSGNAFLKVETNTDVANATTSIILRAESSNSTSDRQYDLTTDASSNDDFVLLCTTNQNGTLEGFRFNPGGRVTFAGGNNPITSFSAADFQVRGSAWFRNVMRITGVTTLEDNLVVGTAGAPRTLTLNGNEISTPVKILHSGSSAPSAGGNYTTLSAARDTRIVVGGLGGNSGTQSHRFYLPTTTVEGDQIQVVNRANAVYLRIANGSSQFISDGSTRVSATNKYILIQKYSTPPDYFTTITAMESLAADNVTIETTWVTSHGVIY
jgi:hypothetical protein